MTFTYNDPPVDLKDEVRLWAGDTVAKPYSVSDETIGWLLRQYDDQPVVVAAIVCDRIADYWASSSSAGGSKSVGPFSVQQREATSLETSWRERAARLRSGSLDGAPIVAGGMLVGGRPSPEFSVGMTDNGLQKFPDRRRDGEGAPNGVW